MTDHKSIDIRINGEFLNCNTEIIFERDDNRIVLKPWSMHNDALSEMKSFFNNHSFKTMTLVCEVNMDLCEQGLHLSSKEMKVDFEKIYDNEVEIRFGAYHFQRWDLTYFKEFVQRINDLFDETSGLIRY